MAKTSKKHSDPKRVAQIERYMKDMEKLRGVTQRIQSKLEKAKDGPLPPLPPLLP